MTEPFDITRALGRPLGPDDFPTTCGVSLPTRCRDALGILREEEGGPTTTTQVAEVMRRACRDYRRMPNSYVRTALNRLVKLGLAEKDGPQYRAAFVGQAKDLWLDERRRAHHENIRKWNEAQRREAIAQLARAITIAIREARSCEETKASAIALLQMGLQGLEEAP